MWNINSEGFVAARDWSNGSGDGIRPLVKLPTTAKMSWNGTAWDLSN